TYNSARNCGPGHICVLSKTSGATRTSVYVPRGGSENAGTMGAKPDKPGFTGAGIAPEGSLVLGIDVLTLQGVMKFVEHDSAFVFLEKLSLKNGLTSSAAMARYLREHLLHPEQSAALSRLRELMNAPSQGSA